MRAADGAIERELRPSRRHHGLVRQHPLHGPDAGLQSFALRPGLRDTLRPLPVTQYAVDASRAGGRKPIRSYTS